MGVSMKSLCYTNKKEGFGRIVPCLGMTETSPVTFQGFASDSLAVRTGTIGFPANHVEV